METHIIKDADKMIIAVDVDDVVFDLVPRWVSLYNEVSGDNLDYTKIDGWKISEMVSPENVSVLFDVLKRDDLYNDMPIIKNSFEVLRDLKEIGGHRIIFATAGNHPKKEMALKEQGFLTDECDYVFMKDKGLLRADVLIDDGVHNIKSFKGTGVIFTQPWNKYFKARYRVDNWKQAGVFLGLKNSVAV